MQITVLDIAAWIVASYAIFYGYVEPRLFRPYFFLRTWAKLVVFYPLCIITSPAALPFFAIVAVVALADWLRYTVIPALEPYIRL